MRLHEAKKIVFALSDADITAWVQMTIIEDDYKVNFLMNTKIFTINEVNE